MTASVCAPIKGQVIEMPGTVHQEKDNLSFSKYSLERLMLKLKLQHFGHLMRRADSLGKILMLGKTEGKRKGVTEGEMVGWYHRLNGHESEQTPGDSEGQESLACCSTWGRTE